MGLKLRTKVISMSTPLLPTRSPEQHEVLNNTTSAPARYVCFGTFHLDLKKEELFKDGTRVKLQGKVYQALLALLQKPGEIVTREELRMQLWPSDTHVNYDAKVEYADQAVAPQTPPAPKPAGLSSVAALWERTESTASYFRAALTSRWFTAAVVTLVIASMLFGAALVLYAHR